MFIAFSQSERSPDLLAATRTAEPSGTFVLAQLKVAGSRP